jgi:hypothetical protein
MVSRIFEVEVVVSVGGLFFFAGGCGMGEQEQEPAQRGRRERRRKGIDDVKWSASSLT